MMYVPYNCCHKSFEDHYVQQTGNGLNFYRGEALQKGYGFGSFFRTLFRAAVPLLKSGASSVGKEILRSGLNVMSDVSQGNNFKESARKHIKAAGHVLTDKATKKIKNMIGSGHKKRNKRKSNLKKHLIPVKAKKVKRHDDIFS